MRYYKDVKNGYIMAIGTGGGGGVEITESEYDSIMAVIHNKPQTTATTDYHLKIDLTWEEFTPEPIPPSEDISQEEALEILLGGAE